MPVTAVQGCRVFGEPEVRGAGSIAGNIESQQSLKV